MDFINEEYNVNVNEHCAICMHKMNNNTVTLDCKHEFCADCIKQLQSSNLQQKCPLCRAALSIENNDYKIINSNKSINLKDNKYNNKTKNEPKTFYIHFDDIKTCKKFMKYNKNVGTNCCGGKGCIIYNVANQKEISEIKTAFLERNNNNTNYNTRCNIMPFLYR